MLTLLVKEYDGRVTSKLVNPDYKVRPNFRADEFTVNKNDNLDLACVTQYDLDTLQYIRTLYNLIVTVSSVGRTPKYNTGVGGASGSMHQYMFDCLDFIVAEATPAQLEHIFQYLIQRGYKGIGRYKGGRFHIDKRNGELTVWDER